jgi:hypothetical protein
MARVVALPVSLALASRAPMVSPSAALQLDIAVTRRLTVALAATRSLESAVPSHLFLRPRPLLLLCLRYLLRPRLLESAVPPSARLAGVSSSGVSRPSVAQNTTTAVALKGTVEQAATRCTATADLLAPAPAHLYLRLLPLVPLSLSARLPQSHRLHQLPILVSHLLLLFTQLAATLLRQRHSRPHIPAKYTLHLPLLAHTNLHPLPSPRHPFMYPLPDLPPHLPLSPSMTPLSLDTLLPSPIQTLTPPTPRAPHLQPLSLRKMSIQPAALPQYTPTAAPLPSTPTRVTPKFTLLHGRQS